MSAYTSLKTNVVPYQRPSRRKISWIVTFTVVIFLFYFHGDFSSAPFITPRVDFVRGSYDWSQVKPHHPPSSIRSLPSGRPQKLPRIQHKPTRLPRFDVAVQEKRRKIVKETLVKSWQNYKKFAWMRDELKPVTGGGQDTFNGWAATAFDALDTLWIMGLRTEFYEAVHAVTKFDWAKTPDSACIMFETTIRHLGGLLSAYDLSKVPALLQKAIEVGDMLYTGFDTPSHLPPFWLDFDKAKRGTLVPDNQQASASVASLTLEFTRLAQLSGNNKYYEAVARITDLLHHDQNATKVPGIWPTFFDANQGDVTLHTSFTLGAASDSTYEYLLKMQLLLAGTEPQYEEMYRNAADALVKNLLYRPITPDNQDILFAGTANWFADEVHLQADNQHLACFAGGMFAMGGKLYNIPEHIDIGGRLTKGCIWAYDAFPTGIMPEISEMMMCNSLSGCQWDESAWKAQAVKHGTFGYPPKGFLNARDPKYILRPEALESVFIMWRITGDEEYRDAGWRMFENILRVTSTVYGNSALDDVRATEPNLHDSQESFFLAETLKYAYLLFSPPDYMSLDDYVFNTEAHPMKIPKR